MTIEERARNYCLNYDEKYQVAMYKAYIDAAEYQRNINIEKACRLYEEALYQAKRTGIHGIPQMVNMFKKAMEE